MKNLLLLLVHLLTILAKLPGPGGTRAIVADSLLIKHHIDDDITLILEATNKGLAIGNVRFKQETELRDGISVAV